MCSHTHEISRVGYFWNFLNAPEFCSWDVRLIPCNHMVLIVNVMRQGDIQRLTTFPYLYPREEEIWIEKNGARRRGDTAARHLKSAGKYSKYTIAAGAANWSRHHLNLELLREWIYSRAYMHACGYTNVSMYKLLHLECHSISISNLNLCGLFSTERGKRELEHDWDLRIKKWHWKSNWLYNRVWSGYN